MKTLDLDVMAMIVAVADTGNISRAAEVVHRSQSAVSMQIKTLETALGKPLCDVIAGSAPGRQTQDQITIYKAVGVGLQDVALAGLAYRRIVEAQ